MRMVDLIVKKRNGIELSDEEIRFWINGYTHNEIPDYQTSAMTMAIIFKGMSKREIATLTDAMLHSGDIINLDKISGITVDKHSTGGVGDKTSLVLGPMVAACGGVVAKMSGRGLGHTGGTLDKLESIPGMKTNLSIDEFVSQVNKIGIAITGQTGTLVPADKKMYALRDVTGTVESIPLIAASVMSKKLASGTSGILLDVTVGNGAFMKDMDQARELAKTMVEIGTHLGKNTKAVISNMSEPLGFAIGNSLEVIEAINALRGNGPKDLMDLCYTCGSILLEQAKLFSDRESAREALKESVVNGNAFKKFLQMVEQQGGDIEYILHPEKFTKAKYQIEVKARESGYVEKMNAFSLGECSMKLGGGRATTDDLIDMTAGIILKKKVGDYVEMGETVAIAFTNKENVHDVIEEISNSYKFTDIKTEKLSVIREIIG